MVVSFGSSYSTVCIFYIALYGFIQCASQSRECLYLVSLLVVCTSVHFDIPDLELGDKDLDDVDHDAIAHRLRQDVVSILRKVAIP